MARQTKTEKARAETRLLAEEDPSFQIAPMIDILLVLLVFFMSISSTEVLQINDQIQLPVAKDGKEKRPADQGQVIVNVLWNALNNVGTIEVDERDYTDPNELIPYLQARIAAKAECRVIVRADHQVRYDYLKGLLRAAGNAGVKEFTFSVVDKENK